MSDLVVIGWAACGPLGMVLLVRFIGDISLFEALENPLAWIAIPGSVVIGPIMLLAVIASMIVRWARAKTGT